MSHKHKWVLRHKHRMHDDELMWCCDDGQYCFAREAWWKVWVLLGISGNPFEKIHDYQLIARPAKLHEMFICALTGHNYTDWSPRIGWSFWRICRTCRGTEHKLGEHMEKAA